MSRQKPHHITHHDYSVPSKWTIEKTEHHMGGDPERPVFLTVFSLHHPDFDRRTGNGGAAANPDVKVFHPHDGLTDKDGYVRVPHVKLTTPSMAMAFASATIRGSNLLLELHEAKYGEDRPDEADAREKNDRPPRTWDGRYRDPR